MDGILDIFSAAKRLPCFISTPKNTNDAPSTSCVIFIGGLTDNLLACDHLSPLQRRLSEKNWSLVQPFLYSGHTGYGISSLSNDVQDLDDLIEFLKSKYKFQKFVLLGYSTGCQDSIAYLASGKFRSEINAIILQSPVSDREYMMTLPETPQLLELASQMIASGKSEELMPRSASFVPITAYRYHSLAAVGGDDDMFSSDFGVEEMRKRLGHVACPVSIICGTQDEYVPPHVSISGLAERLKSSMASKVSEICLIEGGNHAIGGDEAHIASFVQAVEQFVSRHCSN